MVTALAVACGNEGCAYEALSLLGNNHIRSSELVTKGLEMPGPSPALSEVVHAVSCLPGLSPEPLM